MSNNKIDFDFLELVILDNCFKNASYLSSIIDFTSPNYFTNSDCKKIYSLLKVFYEKRGRLPSDVEFRSYMSNKHLKNALISVQDSMSRFSGKYNEDELLEHTELFLKERAFASTLEEIVENYEKLNLEEKSSEILEKFTKIFNLTLSTNLGMDYFEEIEKTVESLSKDEDHLSTGFSWLDKKLGGGYKKDGKALYVFSGAPNSGKSIILGNTAVSLLKQNKTVVLITLEMSELVYAERISSQLSRIPTYNLKSSGETLIEYCNEFNQTHKSKLIIKEFANNSIKVAGIENYINDLIKRKNIKPDVIIIDYLNLIAPAKKTGDSYTDVKGISEDVRRLSYTFKCPTISATQLGRSAINKENPGLETTSESIGTAATADVQVSIYSNEGDREIGMVYIGIQRNRYGQNFGTKALRVDWDTLYLEQFEEDDDDSIDGDDLISDAESSLKGFNLT